MCTCEDVLDSMAQFNIIALFSLKLVICMDLYIAIMGTTCMGVIYTLSAWTPFGRLLCMWKEAGIE